MTLLLCFLLQETVEMKDHGSFYLLHKPGAYAETKSWPVILDVGARGQAARDGLARWKIGGGKDSYLIVAVQLRSLAARMEVHLAQRERKGFLCNE